MSLLLCVLFNCPRIGQLDTIPRTLRTEIADDEHSFTDRSQDDDDRFAA